jgi:hypothetical protein
MIRSDKLFIHIHAIRLRPQLQSIGKVPLVLSIDHAPTHGCALAPSIIDRYESWRRFDHKPDSLRRLSEGSGMYKKTITLLTLLLSHTAMAAQISITDVNEWKTALSAKAG